MAGLGAVLFTLALLELGARGIEGYRSREDRNPYAAFTNRARVFERAELAGRGMYRRTSAHWIPGPQQFAATRDVDSLRIFSLGGSAAMGWPHPPDQSYAGLLRRKMRALYPGREVEVLNVAGNTYASYRAKVVFDEIVGYQPDLILVYSGNNEFLENFVYRVDELSGPLERLALIRLIQRIWTRSPDERPVIDVQNYGYADRISTRLSFAFGRAARLREDPAQLQKVIEHYRYTLDSMLSECAQRGIPVMLIDVPVNLKDWIPNVSSHRPDLRADQVSRFREHFRGGMEALERGDIDAAIEALEAAVRIDEAYAETQYFLGVAYHRADRIREARERYLRALREDAYPFRSLPEFDRIRREVARRHGATVIEATAALEAKADDEIIGLDVLVDYVHPSVQSNELIAHEVLRAMDREGLLPEPRAGPIEQARVAVPADLEETLQVLFGLQSQYLVMRQYDHLDGISERLVAAAARAAKARPEMSSLNQLLKERVESIRRVIGPYRRLLRAEKLGSLEEKFSEEEARAVYKDYIELIRTLEAGVMLPAEFQEFVPPLQYGEGVPNADS